ncbi:ABC transporter substrate-binding protein [Bradyrhizobium neotropicale]|uniref:ABC transporter substrate-binding protein n=1 Tax=Bradyrhizobium neotropicale TaxID=1497615 RepID=UPI003908250D
MADNEIRIGNLMPYSGNLQIFGAIGKAEAAYFEMLNERGGINGRKVRFISYDDKSDAASSLSLTRALVEQDKVLLMFGSFGTPGNFAVRKYLNEKQIPQLLLPATIISAIQARSQGQWAGSLRSEKRDASTRITSRHSTRERGSWFSGRMTTSVVRSSRVWRMG